MKNYNKVKAVNQGLVRVLPFVLLSLLVLPIFALAISPSAVDLVQGLQHPLFLPALTLSLKTSIISLVIVVITGTPLAWYLARSNSRKTDIIAILIDLPIVIPPAVIGIALLRTFGRNGLLGSFLQNMDIQIPFTMMAVVIAQVVVSAPFYVQSAANAFRKVDDNLIYVARTLGASPLQVFFKVGFPLALPGLISAMSLAWARALGEFGATLLFAGNLSGKTQTMPLAIYMSLESDVSAAITISLALAVISILLLLSLRIIPAYWERKRNKPAVFRVS